MVLCEYSSCGRDVPEDSFTRARHWPCCGKPLIGYEPVLVEEKVEEKPAEEEPVVIPVEKKTKKPAKKAAPKKKKAKK